MKNKKYMMIIVAIVIATVFIGIFTAQTMKRSEMKNKLFSYQEQLFAMEKEYVDLKNSSVSWRSFFDKTSEMELKAAGIAREISGVQIDIQYKKDLYAYAISLKEFYNASNLFGRVTLDYNNKTDWIDSFPYFVDKKDFEELYELEDEYNIASDTMDKAKFSKEKAKKVLDKYKKI